MTIEKQITQKYLTNNNSAIFIDEGKHFLYIIKIRIDEKIQEQGIGSHILNEIKKYAKQNNKTIVLDAYPDVFTGTITQKKLNEFYEKNSFQKLNSDEFPIFFDENKRVKIYGQAYYYN